MITRILANYKGQYVIKALYESTEYSAFVTITYRKDGRLLEDLWEVCGNVEEDGLWSTKELEHDADIS